MLIYQCGAISEYIERDEFYKATEWRKKQQENLRQLGFKFYDPCKCFKDEFPSEKINDMSIIMNNLVYLKKCDLMTVNLEYIDKSPGSICEMWEFWRQQKPILTFGEYIKDIKYPHILGIITQHFESLEELCKYINVMYRQFTNRYN